MVERTAVMKKMSQKCGKRRRRHAFYAAAFVAAATMLTLAANAGSAILGGRQGLQIDISKERYTVLTHETESILDRLNRDVYLYYTGSTDVDDLRVTQLLKSYAAASPRVMYRLVDPTVHPGFTQLYDPQQTGIEPGSVIVSDSDGYSGHAPGHFEVLQKDDLYVSSAPYYDGRGRLVSDYRYFRAEQKLTSVISYIMTEQNLRAVFLSGQEEEPPSERLVSDLSGLFYETRISDLTDVQLSPRNDTLIVISPKSDLSEAVYEKIKLFFEQGGKGMFFIDSVMSETNDKKTESHIRFDALLSDFGLLAQRNIIVGADPAHTYMSRMNLVPLLSQDSPITQPITENGLTPVLSYAGAITVSYIHGVDTSVLLETDASSYAKTPQEALDTCSKQAEDITGPFVIGVLAKKGNAQMALFGSSSPVSSGYGIPGNRRLFLNTLSHLNGRQESDIIPMRTIYAASDDEYKINISSGFEKVFYIGLTAVVIPLTVLIIGISKWYRRRHM